MNGWPRRGASIAAGLAASLLARKKNQKFVTLVTVSTPPVEAGIELLRPAPDEMLQRWPVSKRVNSSKAPADDPTLIDRIDLSTAQQLAGRRSDSNRD